MDDNSSDLSPKVVKIKKGMTKKVILVILLAIYSLLLLFLGFILGGNYSKRDIAKLSPLVNPLDPMFANLTGTIRGKIVKIEQTKAYVLSQEGGSAIFSLAKPLTITEWKNNKVNSLGNSQDQIRIGEDAVLKIRPLGKGFGIFSIAYIGNPQLSVEIPESSTDAKLKNK